MVYYNRGVKASVSARLLHIIHMYATAAVFVLQTEVFVCIHMHTRVKSRRAGDSKTAAAAAAAAATGFKS